MMKLNELPRQKLIEIIADHGQTLCDSPNRCVGLLKDYCPEYKLEINLLAAALRQNICKDLLTYLSSKLADITIKRLAKRLQNETGLSAAHSQWAIESWALALGLIFKPHITTNENLRIKTVFRRVLFSISLQTALAFFCGFALGLITLKGDDYDDIEADDNLVPFVCLLILGALLILDRRICHKRWLPKWVRPNPRWIRTGIYVLFGILHSVYGGFFSTIPGSDFLWMSVLILILLIVANEIYRRESRNDFPELLFYFFFTFTFFLFSIPVTTLISPKGVWLKVMSAVCSIGLTAFIAVGIGIYPRPIGADSSGSTSRNYKLWTTKLTRSLAICCLSCLIILGFLYGLIKLRLVPPIPISLRSAGIFPDCELGKEEKRPS